MKSLEANGKPPLPQETQSPRPQAKFSADMSPALIAQANWTFVEKLLKVNLHFHNLIRCTHDVLFHDILSLFRTVNLKRNGCW